jgi:hypothetical protein
VTQTDIDRPANLLLFAEPHLDANRKLLELQLPEPQGPILQIRISDGNQKLLAYETEVSVGIDSSVRSGEGEQRASMVRELAWHGCPFRRGTCLHIKMNMVHNPHKECLSPSRRRLPHSHACGTPGVGL